MQLPGLPRSTPVRHPRVSCLAALSAVSPRTTPDHTHRRLTPRARVACAAQRVSDPLPADSCEPPSHTSPTEPPVTPGGRWPRDGASVRVVKRATYPHLCTDVSSSSVSTPSRRALATSVRVMLLTAGRKVGAWRHSPICDNAYSAAPEPGSPSPTTLSERLTAPSPASVRRTLECPLDPCARAQISHVPAQGGRPPSSPQAEDARFDSWLVLRAHPPRQTRPAGLYAVHAPPAPSLFVAPHAHRSPACRCARRASCPSPQHAQEQRTRARAAAAACRVAGVAAKGRAWRGVCARVL